MPLHAKYSLAIVFVQWIFYHIQVLLTRFSILRSEIINQMVLRVPCQYFQHLWNAKQLESLLCSWSTDRNRFFYSLCLFANEMAVHSFSLARFGWGERRVQKSLSAHSTKTKAKQTSERERSEKSAQNLQNVQHGTHTAYEAHKIQNEKKQSRNTSQSYPMIKAFYFQHRITMVIEWKHCLPGDTVWQCMC